MIDAYRTIPIRPATPEAVTIDPDEPLIRIDGCLPRVLNLASYLARGVPGSIPECWMRASVARRIFAAADTLPEGWALAVYDAWRPWAVQQALFDEYLEQLRHRHPDWADGALQKAARQFVAYPDRSRPGGHQSGGAVDLTIYAHGRPLDMGTGFDHFGPEAYTVHFEDTPGEIRENRRILYHLMGAFGFTNYADEWWHYDFGNGSWARITGAKACYGGAEPKAE